MARAGRKRKAGHRWANGNVKQPNAARGRTPASRSRQRASCSSRKCESSITAWAGALNQSHVAAIGGTCYSTSVCSVLPNWFTVTTTPVASAASSTGTLSSTRVISGLNASAVRSAE